MNPVYVFTPAYGYWRITSEHMEKILDSVGMYNAGLSPKVIKARREYAKKSKSIYRVLLARKIIEERKNTVIKEEP